MRVCVILLWVALLLAAGCTQQQHEDWGRKFDDLSGGLKRVEGALASPAAKTIAAVATPALPAAEPARQTGEWLAGGIAAALALLAAWQKKKAGEAQKERDEEEARLKTQRLELIRAVGDQATVDRAMAKAQEKNG
jgi:hypothetical protein